jgi:hypothetical protein
MKVNPSSAARFFIFILFCTSSVFSAAQACFTSDDMDAATRTALQNTALRYFDMVARGDAAALRQASIPDVANNFTGIENTIKESQGDLAGAHATVRPVFQLKAEGAAALERAEFLCGIFNGPQAVNSADIVIPNLPPGTYGLTILDVAGKSPYTLTFILQQQGTDWKLGGFFLHAEQTAGHDASWYQQKARDFKTKGQTHNAWLYFLLARDLAMPVYFLYTQPTNKMYEEEQSVRPSDFPVDGSVVDLAAADGKVYKLTAVFPITVQQNLNVVVKYRTASVADTGQSFRENMNVMRALLAKFPELRDAFEGFVVRAVEPSGRDYGSMMPMKDVK